MKKNTLLVLLIAVISFVGYFLDTPDTSYKSQYPAMENELRVHYIDVGQGDSAFIELPDEKTMLIDAGNPENGEDIVDYIKHLGYDSVDYVVGTHPHSDHIGGMAKVIYNLNVNYIYMPKISHNTTIFENLLETIQNKKLTVKTAKAGVTIHSDDSLNIEILSPVRDSYKELNDYSAVIKITYLNTSFLFMGDAEKLVETDLMKSDIDCDVLKVGHHGSDSSSMKSFIQKVSPDYSIISVGNDNDYNHPHKKVLNNLKNSNVLRTDMNGTIIITSDGNNINYII